MMLTKMGVPFMWIIAVLLGVEAQVGPQAAQLPACIKACDPAAIASVNCTNADQYCHCIKQTGILRNITACADASCTNPSASLYTFTTLFGEVCSQFNISVPVLGSNASANGTIVVLPTLTASAVAYTGGMSSREIGRNDILLAVLTTGLLVFGVIIQIV